MNGYELKKTVCALGFNSALPNDESFFDAANLAQLRLNAILPRKETVELGAVPSLSADRRAVGKELFDGQSTHGSFEMQNGRLRYDMSGEPGFVAISRVWGGGYDVSGSSVLVPLGARGAYTVEYIRAPRRLTPDCMKEELDVDPLLTELMPLLCAYYVWLEDEPSKAEEYRKEFDVALEGILRLRRARCESVGSNGW